MADRILLVDDDANLLSACERALRAELRQGLPLEVTTAAGGAAALERLQALGPFAVVVSDLKIPAPNGTPFLSHVRQTAPDTSRIVLTGNADLQAVLDAVNEGIAFRFLTKPCSPESLVAALRAGVAQYRLVLAERELLEDTVGGSIKLLTELLEIASPVAFRRASRIQQIVRMVLPKFARENAWTLDLTAMLSQIGVVAVPEEILAKMDRGQPLTSEEAAIWNAHPKTGHDLIRNIPRLKEVAKSVLYQLKQFDGAGPPAGAVRGQTIPLGGRVLKAVLDYDYLVQGGMTSEQASAELNSRRGCYDPEVTQALQSAVVQVEAGYSLRLVRVEQLVGGMVVRDGIFAAAGNLIIGKKQMITPALLERVQNFARWQAVVQPVWVLEPLGTAKPIALEDDTEPKTKVV